MCGRDDGGMIDLDMPGDIWMDLKLLKWILNQKNLIYIQIQQLSIFWLGWKIIPLKESCFLIIWCFKKIMQCCDPNTMLWSPDIFDCKIFECSTGLVDLWSLLEYPSIIMMLRCREGLVPRKPTTLLKKQKETSCHHRPPHGVPRQVGLGVGIEEEGSKCSGCRPRQLRSALN